ncbi:protein of unknown function [[Clostridium] ultunense Esp]|uniref:Uncharacterized protein n=1 Tax=[Clostridium] ultunense Esp TaxID=1288971 RepID=A0A1M4PKM5_9FIRM|nr:protein of unknown function [[Clostridium] ultunense Esp]
MKDLYSYYSVFRKSFAITYYKVIEINNARWNIINFVNFIIT